MGKIAEMKSIMQLKKECYFCHTTKDLHLHHIYGGGNRKISERHGFVVYLCFKHHTGDEGVHRFPEALKALKQICQRTYEEKHSREKFIRLIGKSYLEE